MESIRKNFKDRKSVVLRALYPSEKAVVEDKESYIVLTNYSMSTATTSYYSKKSLCLVKMLKVDKTWSLTKVIESILQCFAHLLPDYNMEETAISNFDPYIKRKAFKLNYFKNYGMSCPFCSSKCDGCPIPLSEEPYGRFFKEEKVEF